MDEDLRRSRVSEGGKPEERHTDSQGIVNPDAYGIYYQRYTEMGSAEFRVLEAENATEF